MSRPGVKELRRAAAVQRIAVARAELAVGARELEAKYIGKSPPEYYELRKIAAELESLERRMTTAPEAT
jgi:hypothetical protein